MGIFFLIQNSIHSISTSVLSNLALSRAGKLLSNNSILASDAFFPFPDSIDIAAENNIKTILQPGGSLKDNEVIERANHYNITMILTNRRHFSH